MNKCLTCGKECKNIYCNQKCYSKSPKLKMQAKNSKLIRLNKNNKWALGHKAKPNSGNFKKGQIPWNKGKKLPHLSGKKSPTWKGGITKLDKQIRNSSEYKKWRSDVFQRDNWTCQTCQGRSKVGKRVVLEAHHIKTFKSILKDNNIKTLKESLDCKELWNKDNGETLCLDCHNLTKGWKNGRKEKD